MPLRLSKSTSLAGRSQPVRLRNFEPHARMLLLQTEDTDLMELSTSTRPPSSIQLLIVYLERGMAVGSSFPRASGAPISEAVTILSLLDPWVPFCKSLIRRTARVNLCSDGPWSGDHRSSLASRGRWEYYQLLEIHTSMNQRGSTWRNDCKIFSDNLAASILFGREERNARDQRFQVRGQVPLLRLCRVIPD